MVNARKKKPVVGLDVLYDEVHNEIPRRVLARDPPSFSKKEIVQVMDLKLALGQFRPALKGGRVL